MVVMPFCLTIVSHEGTMFKDTIATVHGFYAQWHRLVKNIEGQTKIFGGKSGNDGWKHRLLSSPPKSTPIPVSHIISSVNLLKFHLYHSYFEVLLAVCKITDVEVIGVYYSEISF